MNGLEQQLFELEEDLLQPATRRSAEAIASLLASDFCEFGSSGRVFNRQQVIEALQKEAPARFSIRDFRVTLLAADAALVTYQAEQQASVSLRSSVWVMRDARWQMLFHQGTACP
jgi:hypothetical protein